MKVIEPTRTENLVRADSILQEKAFKDTEGGYFIVLDMQRGYFDCSVRPTTRIDYKSIWVFNVRTCTLGIIDEDEMVEPVELTVNVEGIE